MKPSPFIATVLEAWKAALSTHAATLSFSGPPSFGPGWRTATVGKPFDTDGDIVIGTDGYHLANLLDGPIHTSVVTHSPHGVSISGGTALIFQPSNLGIYSSARPRVVVEDAAIPTPPGTTVAARGGQHHLHRAVRQR